MITVLMCQQGIPFQVSPARTQMINELKQRGSDVFLFFPGNVDGKMRKQVTKIVNTKKLKNKTIQKKIQEINPDIVICSTIEDIKVCFLLPHIMKNTDFYYYNLEIYVPPVGNEKHNFIERYLKKIVYKMNKGKEKVYVKGCRSIVIQDRLRKKILQKHGISHPFTWMIPNSYYYVQQKPDVPHKKGIVYSGSVGMDMLGSFLKHVDEIKDVEITIAGWNYPNINFTKCPNINIIRQNLSQDAYTKFISAYDIALLWYSDERDDNIYNIGLASGKFFKHLSLRQPVIVNSVPGLAEEIIRYNLGVVIENLGELGDAVEKIRANYSYYVKNIEYRYMKKYDYKKAAQLFFDDIVNNVRIVGQSKHE